MKWKMPGYELDDISDKIIEKYNNKRFYIYGAGLRGKRIYQVLNTLTDYKIAAFIDQDEKKQKETYCDKQVLSLEQITCANGTELEDSIILIALEQDIGEKVKMDLEDMFLHRNIYCLSYEEFMHYDFPVLALYKYNKCYINTISILVTEKCTLRCEKCAIMLPYLKEANEYNIEQLKQEVDLLFNQIDMIGNITITGGEPLLFKELNSFIEYIGKRYRNKIGTFRIITNGTIEPSNELIKTMNKYEMSVEISDYTQAVPILKDKIQSVVNLFKQNHIDTYFLTLAKWVDFGFEYVNKDNLSEEELIRFYDYCHTMCRGYIGGKINYCINAKLAERALNKPEDKSNIFSLYDLKDNLHSKKKLIEFDRGYNTNGYLEMCRYCNGSCEINKNYVEVGIQCKNR